MRIGSWNVDSIRARMPLVEAWIERHDPDVLCLQETRVAGRSFPVTPFAERGLEVVAAGDGGHGGVAMASRVGVTEVQLAIPGARSPLDEPRTISATIPSPGGGLRLHTVYAPNGRRVGTAPHRIKLAWLELFGAWVTIDGLDDGRPTVVAGDLNVAPTDDDVWEPRRYRKRNLTSPPERAAFAGLLDRGLVDVVRARHGAGPLYSWWNRRGDFFETDRGWRLDHLLTDPSTAQTVVDARIDRAERAREGASDHAPLILDLDEQR